jgi:tetratricopeptide (TPR) repeat protein
MRGKIATAGAMVSMAATLFASGPVLAAAPTPTVPPATAPGAATPATGGPKVPTAPLATMPGLSTPRVVRAGAAPSHLGRADKLAWEAGDLIAKGQLPGAEGKATQALGVDNKNPNAHYQLARIRFLKGQGPLALQSVNMALASTPTHAESLLLLVRIEASQGQPGSSFSRLQTLANTHRDNLGVQLAYGEVQLATKKHAQARTSATRVLKLSETSVAAMKLLARVYLELDRNGAADYILTEALKRSRDPEALVLSAGIRHAEGKIVEARVLVEEALKLAPGYLEALNCAGALYLELRNNDAASTVLLQAVATAPAYAAAWLNLGSAQRGQGQFVAAETSWKRVRSLAPKMGEAWYNLGVLYLENPMEGRDRVKQLTDAVNAFQAFKRLGGPSAPLDTKVEKYIDQGRLLIKQEIDRRKEELKTPESDEPADDTPAG